MLNQCLEFLVQKIQSGVVINFEKTGPDPPPLEGTRQICLSFISKGPFYHLLRCICLIYRESLLLHTQCFITIYLKQLLDFIV